VPGAELGAPEDVDDVDRSGGGDGVAEGPVALETLDDLLVRVYRHDVVARPDEESKDAVRGAMRLRRGADHRDPAAGAEDLGDRRVIQDVDVETAILEVDQLLEPGGLGLVGPAVPSLGQARASFANGRPSAAGATLLPTTPARMMMVSR
jgi:hypothetical protein